AGTRTFGYEATIYKALQVHAPGFATTVDIYRTDLAITDEAAHRFHQRVTYYFPQSAHLSSSSLNAHVGNTWLRSASSDVMNLDGTFSAGAIHLRLQLQGPPMYVGGQGFVQFGKQFSYYYSLPNLEARGTLHAGGRTYAVSGISWLDHQWGNWPLQGGVTGWTWMALQLDNGTRLSLFDVRGVGSPILFASVLQKNGATAKISGVTITSTGSWRSPHTGTTYPSGWIVRIPALRAVMRVVPTVIDQEIVSPGQLLGGNAAASVLASYWEGSGRVTGRYSGKPITGLSYTELTGYAKG
ncbi:MAG TPA: lipocalin family protein, partial [Chloroflexota bacterium]